MARFDQAAVILAQTFVALPFLVVSLEGALRTAGQRYEAVAETDRLYDAVDYGAVASAVVEIATGRRFALIERLAAAIGDTLLTRFAVERVTVTVHKPSALTRRS